MAELKWISIEYELPVDLVKILIYVPDHVKESKGINHMGIYTAYRNHEDIIIFGRGAYEKIKREDIANWTYIVPPGKFYIDGYEGFMPEATTKTGE